MQTPPELAPYARTMTLKALPTGLFFYDVGAKSAPALFLLHGLGDEADTWRRVIDPLSRSYRVIAPDIPGFGRSPLPGRKLFNLPFLCDMLLDLLDSLDIDRAGFVGSSMGGSILQYVASVRPQACSRLVLIDGGLAATTRIPSWMFPMLIPGIGERSYRGLKLDQEAAYASLRPYYASLDQLPHDQQDFLRARVGERVASATQRTAYFALLRGIVYWMLLHGARLLRTVERLDVPTTYIWGSEDRIVPLEAARAMSERQPRAQFVVIKGAGHLPQQEKPDELLALIAG